MRADNSQTSLVALICLIAFAATFIIYTARYLPASVANHFGTDGRADAWMSRAAYVWFTLGFLVGLPLLISYLLNALPRRLPQWTNIPNREYWLEPERRDASLEFLAAQGYRLACLIVMLTMGLHYTILLANQQNPPVLPIRPFFSMIGAFFIVLFLWVIKFFQRFPKADRA